ncbi:hypothetical protein SSS_04831 [Sarcoptes scabiei]|uniref:Spaetzle domain-containing protein n=1 Tax=Sarcoptes scabiei TaxID=52283 RepID=A0A834R747_SARSC|nr:hypothetical protein SSS_04831 [Sarcoptes scabiei]
MKILREFPKPSPVKYLPGPQYCPETGRTVCSKVSPYYPLDEVLMVVKMMQATRFNLSSEFVDESENASEPFPNEDYEEYGDFDTFSPSFDSGRSYREDNIVMMRSIINNLHHNNRHIFREQFDHFLLLLILEQLCPSRVILLEPKAALNDRRQWKYVVNLAERDPRLKQAIKVEVCTTPNAPCNNQISLPFGYVSLTRSSETTMGRSASASSTIQSSLVPSESFLKNRHEMITTPGKKFSQSALSSRKLMLNSDDATTTIATTITSQQSIATKTDPTRTENRKIRDYELEETSSAIKH